MNESVPISRVMFTLSKQTTKSIHFEVERKKLQYRKQDATMAYIGLPLNAVM